MRFIAVDEDGTHIPLPPADEIGEYINRERCSRNLSLRALADILGVQRQAVWGWEQNRSLPSLERLAEIVKLFTAEDDEDEATSSVRGRLSQLEEAERIFGV